MKVSPCAPFQLKLFNDIFSDVFFIHFLKNSSKTFLEKHLVRISIFLIVLAFVFCRQQIP